MAAIKSFSDLEQSRKLAEILPIESADMEYLTIKENGASVASVPFVKDDSEVEDSAYSHIYDRIACWSLAALLGVLPKSLIYTPNQALDGYCCKNIMHDFETYGDNPVDACVAMIESLHKQKML